MTDRNPERQRSNEPIREDDEPTFTTTGDDTAWDSGRTSSVTRGSKLEKDVREGDAEAPGVSGPKENR